MVKVEVIYLPDDQQIFQKHCLLPEGALVAHALTQSGIVEQHPETAALSVGIFGKKVTPDTLLREGDRVEIYRPLTNDPKEKRRIRAKQ